MTDKLEKDAALAAEINLKMLSDGKDDYCRPEDLIRDAQSFALRNESVRAIYANKMLFDAQAAYDARQKFSTVKVLQKLTTDEQMKLIRAFHEFRLDFSQGTDCGPHYFARAHRHLSELYLHKILNYDKRSRPAAGFDCVLKDVGGNENRNMLDGRINMHTCAPVLSFNDAFRRQKHQLTLMQPLRVRPVVAQLVELYRNRDARVVCAARSEYCRVKAPLVQCLHSSYDITLPRLGDIMVSAGARHLAGCIIFHPIVLEQQAGVIPEQGCRFEKFRNHLGLRIRFSFPDDVQLGYEHDYATYLAYITGFGFRAECSDDRFILSLREIRNSVAFYEIVRMHTPFCPRDNPFRVITLRNDLTSFVIYHWDWRTIPKNEIVHDSLSHMLPVRTVIPKILFNRIYSYGMSLPDGKFTIRNLLVAANAFNNREIISGQSVGVPSDPMEPDELAGAVHAIYALIYIRNYEHLQGWLQIKDDEDRVRVTGSSSILRRLCSPGVYSSLFARVVGKQAGYQKHPLLGQLQAEPEDKPCFFKKFLASLVAVDRKFPIVVEKAISFVTLSEEVAMHFDQAIRIAQLDQFTYQSNDADAIRKNLNIELAKQHLDQLFPCENERSSEYQAERYEAPAQTPCCDPRKKRVVPNRGGGDCFFYSVRDAGAFDGEPAELRQRLVMSKHRNRFSQADDDAVHAILVAPPGPIDSWADDRVALLCAFELGIHICMHNDLTDKNCNDFNDEAGKTIHIQYTPNHYEALVPIDELPDSLNDLLTEDCKLAQEYPDNKKFFDAVFNSGFSKKDLKAVKADYDEYSSLGFGGYINRAGLKLAELVHRYSIEVEGKICLDLAGGPGGFSSFLTDRGAARVYANTLSTHIPFDRSVYQPNFEELISCDALGDLTDSDVRGEIIEKMAKTVDLVTADGFPDCDVENGLCPPAFEELFLAEVAVALACLRRGGNFVVKSFSQSTISIRQAIASLIKCFSKVYCDKPITSRSASGEYYVVCLGFVGSATFPTDLFLNRPCLTPSVVVQNFEAKVAQHVQKGLLMMVRLLRARKEGRTFVLDAKPHVLEQMKKLLFRRTVRKGAGLWEKISTFLFPKAFDVDTISNNSFETAVELESVVFEDFEEVRSNVTGDLEEFADFMSDYSSVISDQEVVLGRPGVPGTHDLKRAMVRVSVVEEAVKTKKSLADVVSTWWALMKTMRQPVLDPSLVVVPSPGQIDYSYFENLEPNLPLPLENRERSRVQADNLKFERPVLESKKTLAMREYLNYLRCTVESQQANHARVLTTLYQNPNAAKIIPEEKSGGTKDFAILDAEGNFLTRRPKIKKHAYIFAAGSFHPFAKLKNFDRALVSDYTELFLDQQILEALMKLDFENFNFDHIRFSFVQAVPGGRKTTTVIGKVAKVNLPWVVLCTTTEGKDDLVARLRSLNIFPEAMLKKSVRTIASLLLNQGITCDALYVDEALMNHSGAIFFCIMLVRPNSVELYGDSAQIPFVNRTPTFKCLYERIDDIVPVDQVLDVTYRCPVDVAAVLDSHYRRLNAKRNLDSGMRSASDVRRSISFKKFVRKEEIPLVVGAKYLVYTQSEKEELIQWFGTKGFVAEVKLLPSTVHEFQGKQHRDVVVVRLSPYPQEELFLRVSYAVVAISRHTHSFLYCSRVETDALATFCLTVPSEEQLDTVQVKKPRVGGMGPSPIHLEPRELIPYQSLHITTQKPPKFGTVIRFDRDAENVRSVVHADLKTVYVPERVLLKGRVDEIRKIIGSASLDCETVHVDVKNLFGHLDVTRFSGTVYSATRHLSVKLVFHVNEYVPHLPPSLFEILNVNGVIDFPNQRIVETFPFEEDLPVSNSVDVDGQFEPSILQRAVHELFPTVSFVDQSLDAWMVHNYDLEIQCGKLTYNPARALYDEKKFDSLRPLVSTQMPLKRSLTSRESLLALVKRNLNVPDMQGTVDIRGTAKVMLDKFIDSYFVREKIIREPIRISGTELTEWAATQDPVVVKNLDPQFCLDLLAVNEYSFSIKTNPKPKLTDAGNKEYVPLQTIVYHAKDINALYCVIIREIKRRVQFAMKDNFHLFTDASPEDFAKKLSRKIPPRFLRRHRKLSKLEVDLSKYDKSQGALALEFICAVMLYFGVPKRFVDIWYHSHVYTRLFDRFTGLLVHIMYQMKSGDASTFLMNTLFLMAVLAYLFCMADVLLGLFGGDDSLLIGFGLDKQVDSSYISLLFNLESKIFSFEKSYFCSKFFLELDDNTWIFAPDPVKLLVKLGRNDLKNFSHLAEYRISFADLVKIYTDDRVVAAVAAAVGERYGYRGDFSPVIRSLCSARLEENFVQLFHTLPTDRLDPNVTDFSIKD